MNQKYADLISDSSLYPTGLKRDQPCGPGIQWVLEKNKRYFKKKNMCQQSSLGEFRFIMTLQYDDPRFRSADGQMVQIQHSYFRGQQKVCGLNIDGFATVDGKTYIIEFNGCYFHAPCPHAGCKFNETYDVKKLGEYEWYIKQKVI